MTIQTKASKRLPLKNSECMKVNKCYAQEQHKAKINKCNS